MKKILKELQEIKKLLLIIVSNQEQKSKKSNVTIDISGIEEIKKQIDDVKNSTS